jgi:hypothetical protein
LFFGVTWAPYRVVRAQSTAFYYGAEVPAELMTAYEQVVVEPANMPKGALPSGHAVPVAYFSLGEVAGGRDGSIDPAWVLGRNQAWGSRVMDLTHPGYRAYLLQRFEALWSAGYRRFFLDTLDSYKLGAANPDQLGEQRGALCEIIKAMEARHPQARWLLNRGFSLLPELASLVDGVVAESLFDRWDAAQGKYTRVPTEDRAWLLARLQEVRERYRLPVTVIDYRPENELAEARTTARKIAGLGFSPWVCNSSLTNIGIGPLEIVPRRVLILTEGEKDQEQAGPARWIAPVLEYLGYIPEYRALSSGLPDYPLRGRYQAIVTTFQSGAVVPDYGAWLLRQVHEGVRVAVFGSLGFAADGPEARELGVAALPAEIPGAGPLRAAEIATRDKLIGFEAEPPSRGVEGVPVTLQGAGVSRHLEVRMPRGGKATAIATTRWGGVALSHVFALRGLYGERAWVLDPFAFLSRALALPDLPVPDTTTESGGRVALFVIDGQGLADRARMRGRPLVSTVLRQVLSHQPYPHAIDLNSNPQASVKIVGGALSEILRVPSVYRGQIAAGTTTARGVTRSLTQLQPLYDVSSPDAIPAPIGPDNSYFEGSAEPYALSRLIETFEYTDTPRRLRPLAFHYHAYSANSPGGLDALDEVYRWLSRQPLFAVRVTDYRARITAFREQVIARDLYGAYLVYGGEALRTLRVPMSLGHPDLSRSNAVASIARLPQGRYVTFAARGLRRLQLAVTTPTRPYLEQTNGRVETWSIGNPQEGRINVQLEVVAEQPLLLRLAGLPPRGSCELKRSGRVTRVRTDAQGRAELSLPEKTTGAAEMVCTPDIAR